MKMILLASALLGFALAAPASAAEMLTCDDATMMKMSGEVEMMTDAAMMEKKKMAMEQLDKAKMAMKDGKMDDCSMHMDEAMKNMPAK